MDDEFPGVTPEQSLLVRQLRQQPAMPPDAVLRELVQQGLGFEEIDARLRCDGLELHPAILAVALSRAALRETTGIRYRACLPWAVKAEHVRAEPLRMLRLLGRRRSGLPLEPTMNARLENWLSGLAGSSTVVAYCPDDERGFAYLPAGWRDGPDDDIPVRVPPLTVRQLGDALAGGQPPASALTPDGAW